MWTLVVSLLFCWSVVEAAVVSFAIRITNSTGAPDGVTRSLILVNGSTPGPALYLNQGDTVEFLVINAMQAPTTIHFHGITQLDTPWSDGVPGLSQTPIAPGGKFLYRWTADDYGTYWYHSHELSQISDGLFGPIFIRPAPTEPTPWHLISPNASDMSAMQVAADTPELVVVGDWDDITAAAKFALSREADLDLYCSNSILVNGRGQINCLSQLQYMAVAANTTIQALNGQNITAQGCTPPTVESEEGDYPHHYSDLPPGVMYGCNATTNTPTVFNVESANIWASFNFICATALQTPMISIDDHEMWVYEADGRFIVPQLVNGFQMYQGQRYAAMVRLKSAPAQQSYTMRVANLGTNQILFGDAIVSYAAPGVNVTGTPYSNASYTYAGLPVGSSIKTLNGSLTVPFPPVQPAAYVNATHIVDISRFGASWKWTMSGNESYQQDAFSSQPLLYHPNNTNGYNSALVIRTLNNTWIDIVLVSTLNNGTPTSPPHAFHKHSNKASVVGFGEGPFNWSSVAEAAQDVPQLFNFDNPPYRDSFVVEGATAGPTWLALRYQSMNPGAWFIHCHIQPHLAGGMGMAILDGIDTWPRIPPQYAPGHNGLSAS